MAKLLMMKSYLKYLYESNQSRWDLFDSEEFINEVTTDDLLDNEHRNRNWKNTV